MNSHTQPTATSRTEALWMKHHAFSNEDQATEALCDFRDLGNALEAELAALRALLHLPPMLLGKMTHAGMCYIGEEHVDGVFIAIAREQLRALARLPMYEQIELRVVAPAAVKAD